MNNLTDGGTYFSWFWILWLGFIFLMLSGMGNWGYSYQAHRKFDGTSRRSAAEILNERYASGEIDRAQYQQLKADINAK